MNRKRLFLLIILLNLCGATLIVVLRSVSPLVRQPEASDVSAGQPLGKLELPARPVIEIFDKDSPKQVEIAKLRTLAFDLAENTLQNLPNNPEAICLLGKLHLRSGNADAARRLWDHVLQIEPNFAEANIDYGHYELNLGNFDEAAVHFRKAIEKDSSRIDAYLPLAESQSSQRNYEAAAKNFDTYLVQNPRAAETWCKLGWAYQQLSKPSEAIVSYSKAVAIEPASSTAVQGLVTAYRALGDSVSAKRYADIAAELAKASPRVVEGRDQFDPDLDKAREVFDFAIRSTTGVLVQANATSIAIAQLEKAKALLPKSDSIRTLLIDLYIAQQAVENAITLLNEQCEQSPGDANAWLRLGVQCIKFRRLDTAEAALRKVIELEPKNAEAYALLAQVQLPAGRNPQGAIQSARIAVQLLPTGSNHFILGTALYHTGDLAGSKQEILKAVELEPRNAEFRAALEQL